MNRKQLEAARVRRFTRNILRTYRAASAQHQKHGASWYAREHDRLAALAREIGASLESVCGAAAAISPGMRWDLVPDYVRLLARADWYSVRVPTYSSEFTRRARACLEGRNPRDVLGGLKVRAFYDLLISRGASDAVVIDGHAFNIARAERSALRRKGEAQPQAARVTAARYRWAAAAYRRAAEILGVAPHAVQAVTWLHWRAMHGVA